jgi:sRNA-binding carbon storage regulator CsrA
MLTLERKTGQRLRIKDRINGYEIWIELHQFRGDKCRISIQAERDRFVIEREEVIEQAKGDK